VVLKNITAAAEYNHCKAEANSLKNGATCNNSIASATIELCPIHNVNG
jgi:hypothetical protein